MGRPSDEVLMAYADGQLDPSEQARIKAILETDPEARERLQLFIATGAPIARLYSKPMNEPVPPHLIALVMNNGTPRRTAVAGASGNGRDVSIAAILHAVESLFFGGLRWQTAAAWGTVAVLTGGAAAGYMNGAGEPELVALKQGQIIAQGPLKEALDHTASGTAVAVRSGAGAAFTTVLTFKNRRQAFCRQYDLRASSGDFAGIACRNDDGQWRLEIHMAVGPKAEPAGRIRPAGGRAAAIEAAVNNAMDGDALGLEEEQALIGRKWAQ